MSPIPSGLSRARTSVSYGNSSVEESYRSVRSGIEQSFKVGIRLPGSGPLVVDLAISGISAAGNGKSIELRNARGQVGATYSNLRVTDALGSSVPAILRSIEHGRAVTISISDRTAVYPLTVDPTWTQVKELTGSDEGSSDELGYSVAISGSTAIVGAPHHKVGTHTEQGEAYVFTEGGGTWSQAQEFTSSDGNGGDQFGYSVAISGSAVIVGAPGHFVSGREGAAYVFSDGGGSWSQEAELSVSDAEAIDEFGSSVAISGPTAVVGDPENVGDPGDRGAGRADIFTESGGTWTLAQEITSSDGSIPDEFGIALAISGSTVLVGAPNHTVGTHTAQGETYVFTESSGTWSQAQEFSSSDGAASDAFGSSVAISGSTAVVGAPKHTVGTNAAQGETYVFTESGGTWSQAQEFSSSDGAASDAFGSTVAISGSTAVVGAPNHSGGAAYVYTTGPQTAPELGIPFGTALGADQTGGGSPSELCACSKGGPPVSADSLDPVDTATGDFHDAATDLSIPGPGVPLAFARTYDAQAAQAEKAAASPAPPLGYGWADNLGMALSYNSTSEVATVTEENGAQTTFGPTSGSSNGWCAALTTNFCASAPRIEATLNHNCTPVLTCTTGTWTFSRNTGTPMTFTFASGTGTEGLSQIADAAGDTLAPSSYTGSACPSGDTCTEWASSASGRNLVLAVNGSGQLVEVVDPTTGQDATFSYSGTGCTSWTMSETPDLCSASDPGTTTGAPQVTTYTYDSGNSSPNLDYDMLTETGPAVGAMVTNCYYGDSCAPSSGGSPGEIYSQENPDGVTSVLCYSGTNSTEAGGTTTVAIDPGGSGCADPVEQTAYTYSSDVLVAAATGTGSSPPTEYYDRDWNSLVDTETVDGDGNVTSNTLQTYYGPGGTPTSSANITSTTDAVGNTTITAYNVANQAYCMVDAADAANGVTCPSSPPTSIPVAGSGQSTTHLGASITYYDASGNPVAVTNPLGYTSTTAYSPTGGSVPPELPYCTVDANEYSVADKTCPSSPPTTPPTGTVTGYTTTIYNSAGYVTSTTNPNGGTTSYTYESSNPALVATNTDPDGTITAYTYDTDTRVIQSLQLSGTYAATSVTAYDPAGHVYCTISPLAYSQGDTTCPAVTAIASGSAGLSLPQSTIDVGSTTGFNTSLPLAVPSNAGIQSVTCTGTTSTTFTGCSGGSGALSGGQTVLQATTAPTRGSDPWPGNIITFFDANNNPIYGVNPVGGVTQTAYNTANQVYCTVAPLAYATPGSPVTCPTSEPTGTFIPTPGSDDYLGATIATHDSLGQVTQVTNPLGGITTTSYDSAGNVHETQVESNNATNAPTIETTYSYDADNRVSETTVGSGSSTETTAQSYDPNENVFCSVSAKNEAGSASCPAWTDSWIATPPIPSTLISSNPDVTTSFYDADGNLLQSTNADGHTTINAYDAAGRNYCTADPTNADAYLAAHTSSTYPYLCPAPGATHVTGTTTTAYDAGGNTLSATDQVGDTTSYTYDAAGDKTEMTDPDSKSTNYCYYGGAGTGTCPTGATAAGWSASTGINGTSVINSVSCVTSSLCVAVNNNGHGDTFNGSAWSNSDVDGSNHIESVSCGQLSFCFAVDNDGNQIEYNGGIWSIAASIDGTNVINSVSCAPQVFFCVAVDAAGNWMSYTSLSGWTKSTSENPIDTSALESVSCPTASLCVAVDAAGKFLTYNGSTWTSPASMGDGSNSMESVSCPTSSFCAAVDDAGHALIYNGSIWGSPSDIDTTRSINSVSCPTTSFCVAVDNHGNEMTYAPTASGFVWTSALSINGTNPLDSVSCTSISFCVGVNDSGHELNFGGTGTANDLLSQTTPVTSADSSGELTTYTYYPGGSPNVTTTPSGTTTDVYDPMGDETNVFYANAASAYVAAPNVSYTYNADGSRATMTDATGVTNYVRDDNDDVTEQELFGDPGLQSSTLSYSYYSTGALDTMTYPSYGTASPTTTPVVTYKYDGFGNMASETDWLGNTVALSYDADNNETEQANVSTTSVPNGTSSTAFSYDAADVSTSNVSTITCPTSGTETLTQGFAGSSGSRNDDGQVTADTSTYSGSCAGSTVQPQHYGYDQAGRVDYEGTAAQGSNPNNFVYNNAGDPTTFSTLTGSTTDTYTDVPDNAGEVTSQTPVSGSGGSTSDYTYDTLGDRISNTSGSITTNYQYDQTGRMTGQTVGSATTGAVTYTGDGLEATTNPTSSGWGSWNTVDSGNAILGVSCATPTFCMAVDNNGDALLWNGSTWTKTTGVDGTRPLESVSCPTSAFCAAVDNHGQMVVYTSSLGWGTPTSVDSTKVLNSVSCPTATSTNCVAVDANGDAVYYNGSTWTDPNISSHALNSVSCVTTTFCKAVDNGGNVFSYNGSWSSADDIDGTHPLESISCSSSSFCLASDNNGGVLYFTGSSWTGAQDIDASRNISAVSCLSATSCQAMDAAGHVLVGGDAGWSSALLVDSAHTPDALSCATLSFCVMTDGGGRVLTYVESQMTWDTNGSLPTVVSDGSDDYIYGPYNEPVEEIGTTATTLSSAPTFMTYTPGNSSWLLTNAAGYETGFYDYDAFGTLSGTQGSALGYAGQYQGTSANTSTFENMRARWYDQETGSFTTRDPDFSETDQAYAYAGDDPVNQTDPSGNGIGIHIPLLGCLGNCGPPVRSSSTTYGGTPRITSKNCDENYLPCVWDLSGADGTGDSNIGFTVTGPANLFVMIFNADDTNTDTNFDVCLQGVTNQCQGAAIHYDETLQVFFPSSDNQIVSVGSHGREAWEAQFQVTISAYPDSAWDLFDQDFGTSPLYFVFISSSNGAISSHSVRANYTSSVSGPGSSCLSTGETLT